MKTFSFIEFGEYLGTRQLGARARKLLVEALRQFNGEKLVLDFTGVSVVANSFADECLAKLLLDMPLEELRRRTTFRGLNEMARHSIATAFRRRLASLAA